MGMWTGFWRDTGTKVARREKDIIQRWFTRHPITFGCAWGMKALTYNVPRAAWRGSRKQVAKWRGYPEVETEQITTDKSETITVVEVTDDGHTRTTTRKTSTNNGTSGGNVVDFAAHQKKKGGAVATPIERGTTVESGHALLQRTYLGKVFMGLATELDAFIPARGAEAISTLHMVSDLHAASVRIASGVEQFSDIIHDCGLDKRITNKLYIAVGVAEDIGRKTLKARRSIEDLYDGQIEQDESRVTSVQTVPVHVVGGGEETGILPLGAAIADAYGAFEPVIDGEATSIMEVIKTSQAAFAVVSEALEGMARRSRQHGLDRRVRDRLRSSADSATDTSAAFKQAKAAMSDLYRGQMHQEESGAGTIRTLPVRSAS